MLGLRFQLPDKRAVSRKASFPQFLAPDHSWSTSSIPRSLKAHLLSSSSAVLCESRRPTSEKKRSSVDNDTVLNIALYI